MSVQSWKCSTKGKRKLVSIASKFLIKRLSHHTTESTGEKAFLLSKHFFCGKITHIFCGYDYQSNVTGTKANRTKTNFFCISYFSPLSFLSIISVESSTVQVSLCGPDREDKARRHLNRITRLDDLESHQDLGEHRWHPPVGTYACVLLMKMPGGTTSRAQMTHTLRRFEWWPNRWPQ